MNEKFKKDFYRMTGKKYSTAGFIFSYLTEHRVRFVYTYRKLQKMSSKRLISKTVWFVYHRHLKTKYGLEINPGVEIGPGLQISHPYNITINNGAKLGNNINLSKGVSIGQENRGKRQGVPIIGDRVYLGINSTVVGKITIGDDVLIAPNSYVNCDVPSHSIVIGNPCKIIHRDNATEGYVNFLV
ncbi:MAG: serine acetyltransferase [Ruminococcus sp.]|nr:serine acetyltransferase [Ruminococcus sp.]